MVKEININDYCFLKEELRNGIKVVFSTAANSLNFNKNTEEGIHNLNRIKEWFHVNKVIYLNQVHGIKVIKCDNDDIVGNDGDGIITDRSGYALGVFTADCVPVLLVDEEKRAVAALHSGWKGTIGNIAAEGIDSMVKEYNSNPSDIKVYIGPHNRQCCYEVSDALIDRFSNEKIFKNQDINSGRMLSLKKCIEIQLLNKGIKEENIMDINLCTHCSNEVKLYSYRKEDEKMARLFSFVFIEEMDK